MNNRKAHAAFETGWPLVEPSPDRYCVMDGFNIDGRKKERVKKDRRRQSAWLSQMMAHNSMRDTIEPEGV